MGRRLSIPAVLTLLVACWRIGEPTEEAALVTWAAFPDTVVVGQLFSFEFAGPVSSDACGRLDTAVLELRDTLLQLSARRSVYETMCSKSPVSFYEARPLRIDRAGRYRVLTVEGRDLGTLVAIDSGAFSRMRAYGEGTVGRAGGCLLFGPGWLGNQRPFALLGAPPEVQSAGEGRRVWIRGSLIGFRECGAYGSRPVIDVADAEVTDRTANEYY